MKISKHAKITIGALTVGSLLLGSPVAAHWGFGPGRWLRGAGLSAELKLTNNQKAQIKSILADGRDAIRTLYQQLREKHTALREAAKTQPFDEAGVRSQAQELANAQAELIVMRTQLINKALSVLTAEQKAKLDELREQRRQSLKEPREQRSSKHDRQ